MVFYEEIQKNNPKLLETLGNGWDGINQDTLIVDLPEESSKRGYLSKNKREITKAYECFQELKKQARDLKEVLKWVGQCHISYHKFLLLSCIFY